MCCLGQQGFITIDDIRDLLGKCGTVDRAAEIIKEAGHGEAESGSKLSYKEFLAFMRSDGEKGLKTHKEVVAKKASGASGDNLLGRKRSVSGGTVQIPHGVDPMPTQSEGTEVD